MIFEYLSFSFFEDMSIQDNVVGPVPAQNLTQSFGALRNFEVSRQLGQGHFSVVYSARNRYNGVNVALKKVQVKQLPRNSSSNLSIIFLVKSNG